MAGRIGLGFVGAGGICRSRHLPGLKEIEGIDIRAVANRSLDSSSRAAAEFGIPEAVADWREVVCHPKIDAVFVGTWPYMHREVSVAAIEAGKHVFCQARMAPDLEEARKMVDAAGKRPDLVTMVCPAPTRMPYEPYMRDVLVGDKLGEIVSVELTSRSSAALTSERMSWREDRSLSGRQALGLGIYAETLEALLGPYVSLSACTRIVAPTKLDDRGHSVRVEIPQVITVTGTLACGALVTEHHSSLVADATTPGDQLTVWGTGGTMRYSFTSAQLWFAPPGRPLEAVVVDESRQNPWKVEEEFIRAIRGDSPLPHSTALTFEEAMGYMRTVEAVYLSRDRGKTVNPAEL